MTNELERFIFFYKKAHFVLSTHDRNFTSGGTLHPRTTSQQCFESEVLHFFSIASGISGLYFSFSGRTFSILSLCWRQRAYALTSKTSAARAGWLYVLWLVVMGGG